MSQVVKNNRGFLQLLGHCRIHQCEFLLRTATPQQVHALVQVLYNVLKQHIPFPEENREKLLPYKDALISLAEPNVPYRKSIFLCRRVVDLFKTCCPRLSVAWDFFCYKHNNPL